MTWLSYIFAGVLLGGAVLYQQHPADKAESKIGSHYVALVKNPTSDSVLVAVIAPRVDSAIRPLGVLSPHDSGWARLPYGDPPVILLYLNIRGSGWFHSVPPDSIFQADSTQ